MKYSASLFFTLLLLICQAKSEESDAVEGKGDRRWIGKTRCPCLMVYLPDYPSYDNSDFRRLNDHVIRAKPERNEYAGDCKCDDGIIKGERSAEASKYPFERNDRILSRAWNYYFVQVPNYKRFGVKYKIQKKHSLEHSKQHPLRHDHVVDQNARETDPSYKYTGQGDYVHITTSPRNGFQDDKSTGLTYSQTSFPLLKVVTSSTPLGYKHDYVNLNHLKGYGVRCREVAETVSVDEGSNGPVEDAVTVIDTPLNAVDNSRYADKVSYGFGETFATNNAADSDAKCIGEGNYLDLRNDDSGAVPVVDKQSTMKNDRVMNGEKFPTKINLDENASGVRELSKSVYSNHEFSIGAAKTLRYEDELDGTLSRTKRELEIDSDKSKMMLEQQDDGAGWLKNDGNIAELMKKNKSAEVLEKIGLGLGIASDVVKRVGEQVGSTIVGIPAQMVLNQVSTGLKIGSETANTVAQSKRSGSARRKRHLSFQTWRKSSRTRGRTTRTTRPTVPSLYSSS